MEPDKGKKIKKKKRNKVVLIVLVILFFVFGVGAVILRHVPAETYAVEFTDSEAHWATLTGSVSYPSEGIPALGVCAESTDGQDLLCTYQLLSSPNYAYVLGYQIKVPPGKYKVFSHLVREGYEKIGYVDEYKAYYSQFVTCGLEINCTNHKPIEVTVEAGEVKENIDPMDWFNY